MSADIVAIIGGTGELGFGLALRLASAGLKVRLGSRDEQKARDAAARVKAAVPAAHIDGFANAEGAAGAAIVILAVPFTAQASILKSIKPALKTAILVDTTVPLGASIGGRSTRMLGVWEGSAAQAARELLPGVPVVAAFHNVSADVLQDLSATPDCDILLCGDDAAAKERVAQLVRLIPGLRPLDAGPLEMSRIVEGITALLISLNRRYKVQCAGFRITGVTG
jgi:NADPH-dependent F420 reductase